MNGVSEDLVPVVRDAIEAIEQADMIEAADPSVPIMRKQAVWASLAPGLVLLLIALGAEFLDEDTLARVMSIVGTLLTGGGGAYAQRSVYSVESHEIKLEAERQRAAIAVAQRLDAERTQAGERFEAALEDASIGDSFLGEDEQPVQWEGDYAPDLSDLVIDDGDF